MRKLMKLVKKMVRERRTHLKPIVFIIAFAIIGIVTILLSRAATPVTNIEPESGTLSSQVTKNTDVNASGGSYVQFGSGASNGCPAGQYGTPGNCYTLAWTKPAMQSPVYYKVSGSGTSITIKRVDAQGTILNQWTDSTSPRIDALSSTQDTYVTWESATHQRLTFSGGRNWVIIGGEVDNNTTSGLSNDDRAGIEFNDVGENIYVEGMYIHGTSGIDGIRIGGNAHTPAVYVQNSRIVDRRGMNDPTCGVNNGTHADVIQAFGNISALNVDHMTGATDYQGQMWKKDSSTSMTKFGPSDFRNVNYIAITPQQSFTLNFVTSQPVEPVSFTNVYLQHDPAFVYNDPCGSTQQKGQFCQAIVPSAGTTCHTDVSPNYKTWDASFAIPVSGRVTQGLPPGGDYIKAGFPGLDYVSEFP